MKFFENFFQSNQENEPPKIERVSLVPDFKPDEKLENIILRYQKLLQERRALQHDHLIYDTVGPEVKGDEEFRRGASRFNEVQKELLEIESQYGGAMEEYLRSYIELEESPKSSFGVPKDEYHRWQVAGTLREEKARKYDKIIREIIANDPNDPRLNGALEDFKQWTKQEWTDDFY